MAMEFKFCNFGFFLVAMLFSYYQYKNSEVHGLFQSFPQSLAFPSSPSTPSEQCTKSTVVSTNNTRAANRKVRGPVRLSLLSKLLQRLPIDKEI